MSTNSPMCINEVHRLLGRYEQKLELIAAIIKEGGSLYLGSSEVKLIMRILEIPLTPAPVASDPERPLSPEPQPQPPELPL